MVRDCVREGDCERLGVSLKLREGDTEIDALAEQPVGPFTCDPTAAEGVPWPGNTAVNHAPPAK